MANELLILIGLTLLAGLFIYRIAKSGGAGTEPVVFTICLTGALAVIWPALILA